MPIDDRIPDALGRAAGSLPKTAGDWDNVRTRAGTRLRRRRGQAGIALATAAVLVVGVVFATGGDDHHSVVTAPPTAPQVVATINGQVVVLSSDGQVVRTLSENAPNLDATNVTVTPDGETVYVQRGTQCDGTEPPSIWKMSARGGPAFNIGPPGYVGINPIVSPDGRWLAYAGSANAAPGVCDPFDRLIVENLATGAQLHLDYTPTGSVTPVAWDATSSQLGVFINEPAESLPPYAVVVVSDNELVEARRLPQPVGNGYAFLPSDEAITAFPTDTTSRIATFDPGTGVEGRTVTEISMPLYLIDVNRTGDAFLLEGPLGDTPNGHDLYRAAIDVRDPIKIAEHVKDAVWLPAPRRVEGEIVAEVVDNGIPSFVVLSAADGHVVRTLASRAGISYGSSIAVPASGDPIYVAVSEAEGPGGCTNVGSLPALAKLSRDGSLSPTEFRATSDPIMSADGRWLAYSEDQNCFGPSSLGLTDLSNGMKYSPYGEGNQAAVRPLAIAPDGSRLAFFGVDNGDGADAFVMDQLPSDTTPQPLTLPGQIEAGVYLPDGRLLVAYIANGRHNFVTVDDTGAITEHLFESVSEGMVHMSADVSGRLLLVFDGGNVQVWQQGDTMPTPINVGDISVKSASWLPAPTSALTTTTSVPTPIETPRPASIVALQRGDLVEMDSGDGAIRRVIAHDTSFVGSAVSMSPDGTEVLADGINPRGCASNPAATGSSGGIARVALSDGSITDVDLGQDVRAGGGAKWSPDGERFAYSIVDCDEKSSIVVRDRTGGDSKFTAVEGTPSPVGWDTDGHHLLVRVSPVPADGTEQYWYIDTVKSGSIEERGVRVPTLGNLNDLEPLGISGRWVAVIGGDERDGTVPQFVEYDLERGIATRTLFAWEGLADNMSVRVIATDSSGRHLLVTTFVEGSPGYVLYRWSEGDAQPTKIAEAIAGADW